MRYVNNGANFGAGLERNAFRCHELIVSSKRNLTVYQRFYAMTTHLLRLGNAAAIDFVCYAIDLDAFADAFKFGAVSRAHRLGNGVIGI